MPGFGMTEREHIDIMLGKRGFGDFASLKEKKWLDVQPDFETAHFLRGFAHPDGKFRFKPQWAGGAAPNKPPRNMGVAFGPYDRLPEFPDHVDLIEVADDEHPFRLATSPARSFLNSSFAETASSRAKEGGRPELLLHPDDASMLGIAEGGRVELGNDRGEVVLHAKLFAGLKRGVVIAEGIWPNDAHERGEGINVLTGADAPAPHGGAAFHDNKVWVRAAA
jgi:anaerobic selenocysteine-containing dehydrogenase